MMFTTIRPATVTTTYSTIAPIAARMPHVSGGTPLIHPTAAMAKNPKTAVLTDSRRMYALVRGKRRARARPSLGPSQEPWGTQLAVAIRYPSSSSGRNYTSPYQVFPASRARPYSASTGSVSLAGSETVPTDSILVPSAISSYASTGSCGICLDNMADS